MSGLIGLANIGKKERRKRLVLGWVALIVTLAATPFFLHGALPRMAGLALFIPTWFAMLCLIQAYQNT